MISCMSGMFLTRESNVYRSILQWFALGLLVLLSACTGAGKEQGNNSQRIVDTAETGGVLRVGVDPDYIPIIYKENGELTGIEIVLARQLGKELGREVEFIETPWDDLIPALNRGHIDIIMSGMSETAARMQLVQFTEPYMRVGQMAIIRVTDIGSINSPQALYDTSARVGYISNTTGELFVRENLKNAEYVSLKTGDDGIPALRSGEIDVFVHDAPTAWQLAADPEMNDLMALYWPLTEEYLAWAVRKSDTELLEKINTIIEQWKRSGALQATLNRWIRVRVEVR